MDFSAREKKLLALIQDDLPHTLTPFADMGAMCGMAEDEVLHFIAHLREEGIIRRFGASIRHQRAGWKCNAMTAWLASREEADACGPVAAAHPQISHVYYRPSPAADWPYTFYTMIHGRTDTECEKVIHELRSAWPLQDYVVLRSLRELKKTSMTYFPGVEYKFEN